MPSIKTIQNWFQNSDIRGKPGLDEKHLERLRKIANDFKQKNNRELMCSLVFDEMYIRQQVRWSLHQMNYVGFVNYGEKGDGLTVAKQAIVFLLNGIGVNFEFPVAYYFVEDLDAPQRVPLLEEIIATVTECGVKITNLTFDGFSSNIPACETLGANLNVNSTNFKPYIVNPINNEKIYIILDPCHMEKLVRNRWASCGVFIDGNGKRIEWRYIVALYEYSCRNDFHTHKLTKRHIQWNRNSMNVRLAAETFSEAVASSIEFLMQQNIPEFEGAQPTVDFVRRMNTLFDVFNSKNANEKNIFKKNLCAENKRIIFDFLDETSKFFKELKVEQVVFRKKKESKKSKKSKRKSKPEVTRVVVTQQILYTRHKVAFRGFIINNTCLKAMYEEYVEEKQWLKHIPTYNLLQDVIEMFFGRIRATGGHNNNPDVQQFKGAYRRVQANMKMDLSPTSNCRMFDMHLPDDLFFSNIYFVSSKRAKISMDENAYQNQKDDVLDLVDDSISSSGTHYMLDGTANFMLMYAASKIEQKIVECKTFHCNSCRLVFEENDKVDSIDTHFSRWKPCQSTFEISRAAEKFFRLYDGHESMPRFDFKVLYCLIFRSLNFNVIYSQSKFLCDFSHKYQFIKCVVGQYITMRANHIAKRITLARHDKLIRQKCTQLINIKGQ